MKKIYSILLIFLIGISILFAQGNATDDCASIPTLFPDAGCSPYSVDLTGYSLEVGENNPCTVAPAATRSAWYKFVATNTKHSIVFNDLGVSIGACTRIGLAVYGPNPTCMPAGPIANVCAPGNMTITLNPTTLNVGDTYYIQILSNACNRTGCVEVLSPAINDLCANAVALTLNTSCTRGNTSFATNIEGPNETNTFGVPGGPPFAPSCNPSAGGFGRTVWYTFTTSAVTKYVISFSDISTMGGSNFAAQLFPTAACVPAVGTASHCFNNMNAAFEWNVTLTASTTYLMRLGNLNMFNHCVSITEIVDCSVGFGASNTVNDNCADAVNLTVADGTQAWKIGNTYNCTMEAPAVEPSGKCAGWNKAAPNSTSWFKFTTPSAAVCPSGKVAVTTDVTGSGMNTQIEIFNGGQNCTTGFTSLACDDDNGYELPTGQAIFNVTPSTTYYVRVDHNTAAGGIYYIKAICVPQNDVFCTPDTLATNVAKSGTIYGATAWQNGYAPRPGSGNACDCEMNSTHNILKCGGISMENNVFFVYKATSTGMHTVSLSSGACNGTNGYQIFMGVDNATCTTFRGGSPMICSSTAFFSTSFTASVSLTSGTTYRIFVDGFAGEMCSFNMMVSFGVPVAAQLSDFFGKSENLINKLFWVTETENNNEYHVIEKSHDGNSFVEIGRRVSPDGNSLIRQDYSYIDNNINRKVNYYRIRMVAKNGSASFSKTISLVNNISAVFSVYINQLSNDYLNVKLPGFAYSEHQEMNFHIFNIGGILESMGSISITEQQYDNNSIIDIRNLASGIYIIRFNIGPDTYNTRFVKM